MNKKIEELMALNNAVDVICNQVNKDNTEKRIQIKENYKERWQRMWDDLDKCIKVIDSIGYDDCQHIGKYEFGYPRGWIATGASGITFITNRDKDTMVYMDNTTGWDQIVRNDFDFPYSKYKVYVEMLLDKWDKLYGKILEDLEERLTKEIKKKIAKCKIETERLDEQLNKTAI